MTATITDPNAKVAYYLHKATEGPTAQERQNGRRWLRRNGYADLAPKMTTHPRPAPPLRDNRPTITPSLSPATVCRLHEHLDRRCDCYRSH